jgi:CRISPR-associated endoribonuclease Cas6
MRLRLTIRPIQSRTTIPLSYEYYLSAAIYQWIELSSPAFSDFLHNKGYSTETLKRSFKHFCFSQLFIEHSRVVGEEIHINGGNILWYIGMPIEESLQHLVVGLFERREFFIGREENRFSVEQVETLPEPEWKRVMKFRTISPVAVSVAGIAEGNLQSGSRSAEGYLRPKLSARYLKADDPQLSESLRLNVLHRYESLYGKLPTDTELRCTTDGEYIARRGGADRVSKLVTIKKGLPEETKVRGFRCPVTLEGNSELIKLAYESGLGEKGSMGFGMLEVTT